MAYTECPASLSDIERARFWAKVDRGDGYGCWLWTGGKSRGYGLFKRSRGRIVRPTLRAHRVAYEMLVGPIPEGLTLDHVKARGCTSRACVNPAHLEPVTNAENARRGRLGFRGVQGVPRRGGANERKTHCPRSHPYDETNTKHYRGRRVCLACRDSHNAERRLTTSSAEV